VSTELDFSTPEVIHPLTGEALTLATAEDQQLVRFLEEVRQYESLLREAKSLVNRETLRRMDAAVLSGAEQGHTQRVGDWVLKAPAPDTVSEIDGEGLYHHLTILAREGTIGFEAVERCVKTETTYKPQRAQLNALGKVSPYVAQAVAEHTTEIEKPRYVKVSRA
jgi:hypothetical protein